MSKVKPAGFGAPYWAHRVQDALPAGAYTNQEERSAIEGVLEELIAQTRIDEALRCRRTRIDGNGDRIEERIAGHRRDLRAARRRSK